MHVEGNLSPTFQLLLLCTAIVAGDEALCGERGGREKEETGRGREQRRGEKKEERKGEEERGDGEQKGERRKKGRREKEKEQRSEGWGVGRGERREERTMLPALSHTCARSSLERPLD